MREKLFNDVHRIVKMHSRGITSVGKRIRLFESIAKVEHALLPAYIQPLHQQPAALEAPAVWLPQTLSAASALSPPPPKASTERDPTRDVPRALERHFQMALARKCTPTPLWPLPALTRADWTVRRRCTQAEELGSAESIGSPASSSGEKAPVASEAQQPQPELYLHGRRIKVEAILDGSAPAWSHHHTARPRPLQQALAEQIDSLADGLSVSDERKTALMNFKEVRPHSCGPHAYGSDVCVCGADLSGAAGAGGFSSH